MRITKTTALLSTIALVALNACAPRSDAGDSAAGRVGDSAGARQAGDTSRPANCTALETRPVNATGQEPAFRGQTRTCGMTSDVAFDVTVVAKGLAKPWSVEPLPNGDLLVSEKPGRMRIVSAAGQIGAPITGVPKVDSAGQGATPRSGVAA